MYLREQTMPVSITSIVLLLFSLVSFPKVNGHGSIGYFYNPSVGYQQCPTGRWNNIRPNGAGAFICPECPSGWYQNQIGQGSCKQCSGGRTSPRNSPGPCSNPCGPGRYSSSGACTNCNAGQYQDQSSQSSCKTCLIGHYCPSGSITPTRCSAGVIGSSTGLSTPSCTSPCPIANYCLEGSTSGTSCPAGKYGATTNLPTSSCSGNCPAGYICGVGTGDTNTMQDCGPIGVYCLAGTASTAGRKTPQVGYYSSPPTLNGATQAICPTGHYCTNGLKKKCPKGTYGASDGLTSASCSGQCRKGYHCPAGSISATQEPCAPDNDVNKENWYCPTGVGRVQVDNGKMSGPSTVSRNHREYQSNCPSNYVCANGIATEIISWTGKFSPCNNNAISSTIFGWTSDTVATASVLEATNPASAALPITATLATSLTSGTIQYQFHKCPSCCSGQQCVGSCQNTNSPGAPFEIVVNSGVTEMRPTSSNVLDSEACTSPYYYQLSAFTSAGGGATIYCQLALSIGDVNEAPSVPSNQQRTVIEESLKGTEVGLPLLANDPEVLAGTQGLTWSIVANSCIGQGNGNPCPFRIRACSGQLVVEDPTRLDFDDSSVSNPFILQVIAKDDGKPSESSSATTIQSMLPHFLHYYYITYVLTLSLTLRASLIVLYVSNTFSLF